MAKWLGLHVTDDLRELSDQLVRYCLSLLGFCTNSLARLPSFFGRSLSCPFVWLYSILKLSRSSVYEPYCVWVHIFFQHVSVIRNSMTWTIQAYWIFGGHCTIFTYFFTSIVREQAWLFFKHLSHHPSLWRVLCSEMWSVYNRLDTIVFFITYAT